MKRSCECPFAILSLSFNDPARCLVAWHSAQPAFSKDALEGCNIAARQRPCVADIPLHFGHLPARAALHFLMQPRRIGTLLRPLLSQAFSVKVLDGLSSSLGGQGAQHGRIEASWDNGVIPPRFEHPRDFFVSRVAPL